MVNKYKKIKKENPTTRYPQFLSFLPPSCPLPAGRGRMSLPIYSEGVGGGE